MTNKQRREIRARTRTAGPDACWFCKFQHPTWARWRIAKHRGLCAAHYQMARKLGILDMLAEPDARFTAPRDPEIPEAELRELIREARLARGA